MALIRHRQPAVTRVSPHNGNRVYVKPKAPPVLVPSPTAPPPGGGS